LIAFYGTRNHETDYDFPFGLHFPGAAAFANRCRAFFSLSESARSSGGITRSLVVVSIRWGFFAVNKIICVLQRLNNVEAPWGSQREEFHQVVGLTVSPNARTIKPNPNVVSANRSRLPKSWFVLLT
jgi:hypothetical protein